MEPTTWTPERALAMFKDYGGDVLWSDFDAKWGNINADDLDIIAIEALESAAAEVERQKARADKAAAEVRRMNSDTESQVKMIVPYVSGGMLCQPWHVIVKTLAEGEKKQYARADDAEAKLAKVEAWAQRATAEVNADGTGTYAVLQDEIYEALRLMRARPAATERDTAAGELLRAVKDALDLISDLRSYCADAWDWKYGEHWNELAKAIRDRAEAAERAGVRL